MHLKFSASRESERANNQGLLASYTLKLHKAVQVNAWLHTNNDARCASYGTHTYTPGLTEPRGHASPLYQLRGADYAQQITTCSPPFIIFRPSYGQVVGLKASDGQERPFFRPFFHQ